MKSAVLVSALLLHSMAVVAEAPPRRTVEGQVLKSDRLPTLCLRVDEKLNFVGEHAFTIDKLAAGSRFVFAETSKGAVQRLFLAQFESFLPGTDEIYRYNLDSGVEIGGLKWKAMTFAFSNRQAALEKADSEAALTAQFLEGKSLSVPDEWLVARYVTVGDATRKSELILFYMEPLSGFGVRLADLRDGGPGKQMAETISRRSREAFMAVPCSVGKE